MLRANDYQNLSRELAWLPLGFPQQRQTSHAWEVTGQCSCSPFLVRFQVAMMLVLVRWGTPSEWVGKLLKIPQGSPIKIHAQVAVMFGMWCGCSQASWTGTASVSKDAATLAELFHRVVQVFLRICFFFCGLITFRPNCSASVLMWGKHREP